MTSRSEAAGPSFTLTVSKEDGTTSAYEFRRDTNHAAFVATIANRENIYAAEHNLMFGSVDLFNCQVWAWTTIGDLGLWKTTTLKLIPHPNIPSGKILEVFLRIDWKHKTHRVRVRASHTIETLAVEVEALEGVPAELLRISYKGRQAFCGGENIDGQAIYTLKELGVEDDAREIRFVVSGRPAAESWPGDDDDAELRWVYGMRAGMGGRT